MSVFSLKMLFLQIALKTKKIGSFSPVSSTGGRNDQTGYPAVMLKHFCAVAAAAWLLGNYHCFRQKQNFESNHEFLLQWIFLSLEAVRHMAAQRSRARLHQPEAGLDDPSPMEVDVFSPWHIFRCYFVFLKRYSNTINAFLSILGIYLER